MVYLGAQNYSLKDCLGRSYKALTLSVGMWPSKMGKYIHICMGELFRRLPGQMGSNCLVINMLSTFLEGQPNHLLVMPQIAI